MKLKQISAEMLDQYVEKSPYVHYMKTSMWARFKHETEKYSFEFLGFFDQDFLAGTAMVLSSAWLGHSFLYVPWGPCIDYSDLHAVQEAFTLLEQYAREKHVQFLRVDPNVIRMHHDILGNPAKDGFNNEAVTGELIHLGYTHKGYGYAYNGSWTNRYTLIVDLSDDMDTIVSRYSRQRRNALNRCRTDHVSTRIGSREDIPTLMEFEKQLTEQDGFKPHSRKFFEDLLRCFGEHAVLYVTEIDLSGMMDGIQKELSSRKYAKDPEARAAQEKKLAHADELIHQYGRKVKIAAGLFIRYGDMSWDLYTYNHKAFNFANPVDSLHRFAMEDMKNHGVLHYDMCGFSGAAEKDDPYYGLYKYKSSFGPAFIEQIGEFDYVLKPGAMKRFRFEKLAVNHIKRKWWSLRYQKKNG